jgi:8-oxo-dGTP diphosphatase
MSAVRVVGVALLRSAGAGAQVLAARRAGPGGGWELPGGKCEPDEELEAAAVREVLEELGCGIRVTGRLVGVQEIRPGMTLEVVVAEPLTGAPHALEHDELRWLGPTDLDSVDWLPADLPFVARLRPLLAGTVGDPA